MVLALLKLSDDYDNEDNVQLSLGIIGKQLLSDAEVIIIDNVSSEVVNLLKTINSNIVYTITDVSLWNDDKEMDDVHKEEDEVTEDDDPPPPPSPAIEVKKIVSDAQAVGIFYQPLD
ncbi:hypothetical protein QE152_g22010 [Popillia japonica]|uniref:Uncharacterized protein n=1 Tax=Popillia japonica TaxID=7064 RepID=A0AAW1KLQ2_POPJA